MFMFQTCVSLISTPSVSHDRQKYAKNTQNICINSEVQERQCRREKWQGLETTLSRIRMYEVDAWVHEFLSLLSFSPNACIIFHRRWYFISDEIPENIYFGRALTYDFILFRFAHFYVMQENNLPHSFGLCEKFDWRIRAAYVFTFFYTSPHDAPCEFSHFYCFA